MEGEVDRPREEHPTRESERHGSEVPPECRDVEAALAEKARETEVQQRPVRQCQISTNGRREADSCVHRPQCGDRHHESPCCKQRSRRACQRAVRRHPVSRQCTAESNQENEYVAEVERDGERRDNRRGESRGDRETQNNDCDEGLRRQSERDTERDEKPQELEHMSVRRGDGVCADERAEDDECRRQRPVGQTPSGQHRRRTRRDTFKRSATGREEPRNRVGDRAAEG